MLSEMNMSHGKMSDFVSFPLLGFTLDSPPPLSKSLLKTSVWPGITKLSFRSLHQPLHFMKLSPVKIKLSKLSEQTVCWN